MSDLNDQQIDTLIRGHLNNELDSHVGAASRRFADEIANSRKRTAVPLVESPKRQNTAGPKFGSIWSIGLVGAALAATMTIVSMRHNMPFRTTSPKNNGAVRANPDEMSIAPVQNVYPGEANRTWKLEDQGIVTMPDGSRAHKLLRRTTDKFSVIDPKTKKRFEEIRPREETVYVGLKQY